MSAVFLLNKHPYMKEIHMHTYWKRITKILHLFLGNSFKNRISALKMVDVLDKTFQILKKEKA